MNTSDAILTTLATARITHFVTDDSLGYWAIKEPIYKAANNYHQKSTSPTPPWWWKYQEGLECSWCVSVWAAAFMAVSHAVLPSRVWRLMAGALAASYLAARLEITLPTKDHNADDA